VSAIIHTVRRSGAVAIFFLFLNSKRKSASRFLFYHLFEYVNLSLIPVVTLLLSEKKIPD
jgi:hypothetical protein